jgi:hypothetical protein
MELTTIQKERPGRGGGGRGSRQMKRGRGYSIPRNNITSVRHNYVKTVEDSTKNIPMSELTNPLSDTNIKYLISIFPHEFIKLSYETVAPKKVYSPEYDLCMAIPFGKKIYLWYSYYFDTPICVVMELNRDNQINENVTCLSSKDIPTDFELGTILSGTIYEKEGKEESIFLMDDIHMYKGIFLSKMFFYEKTGFLYDFFMELSKTPFFAMKIQLSVLWNSSDETPSTIPYPIRHVQYRSTKKIMPHLNVVNNRKPVLNSGMFSTITSVVLMREYKLDYFKPIFKKNAFFYIRADIAYDVYYIGALHNNEIVYFQHALILNYRTSVLLNGIFRNIRENQSLDAIEESDDESDFENVREDKYVDLEKVVLMECYFHSKFKRWVPITITTEKPTMLQHLL